MGFEPTHLTVSPDDSIGFSSPNPPKKSCQKARFGPKFLEHRRPVALDLIAEASPEELEQGIETLRIPEVDWNVGEGMFRWSWVNCANLN